MKWMRELRLKRTKGKWESLRDRYPIVKEKMEPAVKAVGEKLTPVHGWQSVLLACIITFAFLGTLNTLLTKFPGAVASSTEAQTRTPKKPEDVTQFTFTKEAKVLASSLSEAIPPTPEQEALNEATGLESVPEPSEPATQADWMGPSTDNVNEGSDLELARAVVENFYTDLGNGNTQDAYQRLSPAFQYYLSYPRFQQGYENTTSIYCEVKHFEQLADNKIRVDVAIALIEDAVPVEYVATCVVAKSDQQWYLDGVAQVKS